MINLNSKEKNLINIIKTGPTLTYMLITINVLVYLIVGFVSFYYYKGSIIEIDNRALVMLGAMVNILVEEGQYYRLFTCAFLHSSIIHLALNMYALNSLGSILEKILSKGKLLTIYIVSAILASYGSYLSTRSVYKVSISVGASGAIFGLLGALLVIAFLNRKVIGKALLKSVTEVVIVNIIIGFLIPNIDNVAHVSGLIVGIIITYIILRYPRFKQK